MGNKLTSIPVTIKNIQKEKPASVSHCTCLKHPEQNHKRRGWPANIQYKGAKAVHGLIPEVVLLKKKGSSTNFVHF